MGKRMKINSNNKLIFFEFLLIITITFITMNFVFCYQEGLADDGTAAVYRHLPFADWNWWTTVTFTTPTEYLRNQRMGEWGMPITYTGVSASGTYPSRLFLPYGVGVNIYTDRPDILTPD